MRTFLSILLLAVVTATASNYLIYQKDSSPVTNQCVRTEALYLSSWPTNYGVLTFSLKPGASNWNGVLPNVPLNWCKVSNNLVVAMTVAESNSIVTAQVNAASNQVAQMQINAKVSSTNFLNNYFNTPEGRFQFAFMESVMDALNTIRGGLAGNTNMPLLTLTQLTNAIKVRINGQANSQ